MNDLLVLMVMTKPKHLFDTYTSQLRAAGIDYHVEQVESFPNENSGGTFGYKIQMLRKLATQYSHYGALVFTCAWDMMFFGTKDEVLSKITRGVVLAAERNCYPNPHIAFRIPIVTPWRFVNGGCMAGTPESIIEWTNEIESHANYYPERPDQGQLNMMLADATLPGTLDTRTELFYCMADENGELEFENGLPVNSLFSTRPNFLHFNGRWDHTEAMAMRERSLK